jgi:hypothetical protein
MCAPHKIREPCFGIREDIMSETGGPSLGTELLRIHSIITRGLKISIEYGKSFAEQGYPSARMREGFINYVRSCLAVLDSHHRVEEQMAFPYFRDVIPEAPYELLTSQHQSMLPVLAQSLIVVGEANEFSGNAPSDKLHFLLKAINDIWQPHIRLEEDHFTVGRINRMVSPEEQMRLIKLFVEHSRQYSKPDYLVIPFLLYNLTPEERHAFAKGLPPVVTEELVPVVWREKWAPMEAFLLT